MSVTHMPVSSHTTPCGALSRFVGSALLLCVVGALLGCGSDDPITGLDALLATLQEGTPEEVDAAIAEIGERADQDPERVIPRVAEALANYEGERHIHTFQFVLEHAPEDRIAASLELEAIGKMMPRRLRDYQYMPSHFSIYDDKVLVRMARPALEAEAMARYTSGFIRDLSGRGTLSLVPIVTDPGNDEEVKSLWKGDAASYRAYFDSESKRLREADEAGKVFTPSDPTFPMCLVQPSPGEREAIQPMLTYVSPKLTERFDNRDLTVRGGIDTENQEIVLIVHVKPARQAHMSAWSKTHHGRLMGLVINGDVVRATRISRPFTKEVVLPLGRASEPAVIDRMRAVIRAVATGPYPARLLGELVPPRPEVLDLPIARAMVRIGAPAESALRKIERTGGAMSVVATWALREITRQASGQRKRDVGK